MARIEGTGEQPERRRVRAWRWLRRRAPKSWRAAMWVTAILLPVVVVAPDTFTRAVAATVAIAAAFVYGHHEGRSSMAREVLVR